MTLLLDVDVLVALARPTHVHHAVTRAWFSRREGTWATCAPTRTGLVRLSGPPWSTSP